MKHFLTQATEYTNLNPYYTPKNILKMTAKEKKISAVEWLAEKYNYVTWMRNRDEISAGLADEWRKHYLEQAKEMEKQQVINTPKNILKMTAKEKSDQLVEEFKYILTSDNQCQNDIDNSKITECYIFLTKIN